MEYLNTFTIAYIYKGYSSFRLVSFSLYFGLGSSSSICITPLPKIKNNVLLNRNLGFQT